MSPKNVRFALNAIQWISLKEDPSDPDSAELWRFRDPDFVAEYPGVLRTIRNAGFGTTMLEVLDTQTLQSYGAMIAQSGLSVAPGYIDLPIPSDSEQEIRKGSYEWAHWFDHVRRRAEETNYMGLSSIFIAASVTGTRVTEKAAVGHDFSQDRLDEFVEILTEACEVLRSEGIHPGLHNHVGTWVETAEEIEYVLENVDASLLGASLDVGHLEWAGVDSPLFLSRWADRLVDLHIKDLDLEIARQSRETPVPYYTTVNRGLFLEPGLGQIDLDGVIAALPDSFDGSVIIEVDRASMDPDASALVSANWVRSVQSRP